jgi:hypothetical protein
MLSDPEKAFRGLGKEHLSDEKLKKKAQPADLTVG